MKLISKKSLTSRKLPLIDWEIWTKSGVEPSTDCAYEVESQKIKKQKRLERKQQHDVTIHSKGEKESVH